MIDQYLQLEKRLAELLWPDLRWHIDIVLEEIAGYPVYPRKIAPKWIRDWAAIGPLMIEHRITPRVYDDHVSAEYGSDWDDSTSEFVPEIQITEYFDVNINKEFAARAAIVKALIQKLEGWN